ncbi:hypothetical protein [Bradyrhizobium lablabi]|uniref:hypothetical protein n=1 Tax=Bradyrhizobium lablabi TaxID=722472 RepID=UPI001BA9747C|nr:hypothetical protein [Bradyrhizobium lablabi]MBR0692548.1 hypothetical protein [Bradyrhizobium lablabi]
MSDTPKLSVEKALDKMRASEPRKTKSEQRGEKMDELDEEIRRMREQRLRLERNRRGPTKGG